MKYLEKIQKIMGIFKIISLITMIFAYVSAALTLTGGIMLHLCGQLIPKDGLYDFLVQATDIRSSQLAWVLISIAITMLWIGLLLTFAHGYFVAECKDGTPFTASGANRIKRLGVQSLILSVASVCMTDAIYEAVGLAEWGHFDGASGITIGICLILFSIVLRYGAQLEQEKATGNGKELGAVDSCNLSY